jgi:tRNA-2-methylthio-N6-dimethylallyladenosine synthase
MHDSTEKELLPEDRQGEALLNTEVAGATKKVYIESYGCQMNFSDSEIVASILSKQGYATTDTPESADLVLLNTCSIRDKAEQTVRNRLSHLKHTQKRGNPFKVGVLGCMAERMREQLLEEEKLVDLVVGPDAYRNLPVMLDELEGGQKAVNVLLSRDETYDDIEPVRLGSNGVTAFISIMRGCDNMCAFCVVPFTRGRERSRDPETIVQEARNLFEQGYREVTLLGQNVDSYRWNVDSKGQIKDTSNPIVDFADLMGMVAQVDPRLRIRFSTSHPKDMTDKVLTTMAAYKNICNYIHLPVQSGDSAVLERMNRGYTREWYLDRIGAIHRIIPDCGISTDIITGFCGETEEQHQNTLSLMEEVSFDMAYMFKYSERPKTLAARKFEDDVPEEVKGRRLQEVIAVQGATSKNRYTRFIGQVQEILIEGTSKRSADHLFGRNSQNAVVIVPKADLKPGDYTLARITSATSASLQGELISEEVTIS